MEIFKLPILKLCFMLQKYHEYNVEVVRKDGLLLVRDLAAEVKNHMDFKINAVMVSTQEILPITVTTEHLSNKCA